jgi:type I restriction enzyme S subunit
MQKIFSQQVRFKDENGNPYPDWEEKKLSDVLKERNTQTPISGEYPLMAFVAYKGVAPKGDRYNREFLVSDAKSKKYKQTQLGDFIYSSNNLETGSIGLNLYGSASISPVYSIFETKDGYSHQFLGAYLTRKKFIYQMVRYRQGVVYGQWRIHESEFLKIEEKFPCTGEQQKIATFLTTLDEKITAEKSKLTAAREFKKALLQRMFV